MILEQQRLAKTAEYRDANQWYDFDTAEEIEHWSD